MKFLVVFALVFVSGCNSFPRRLTEEQFLSATSEDDSKTVDIVSGYAQIRRQGRNFASGDKFKFSRPLTVKDPAQFDPPTDTKKVKFDDEKAPVFSLDKMIQEEAEKLKIQVEVASLMAAHAAETAAAHIKAAAQNAVEGGSISGPEMEKIIENAVNSGIHDAEEIVKSEINNEIGENVEVSTDKIEETTSQKPSNVEWAVEEQPSTEHVEFKEAAEAAEPQIEEEKPQEEANQVVEEVEVKETEEKAEVSATTLASPSESEDSKSDDSDENVRTQTTETAHPPRDLDLGSVQEV